MGVIFSDIHYSLLRSIMHIHSLHICFISILFCCLLGSSSLLELSYLHTHHPGVFQPLVVCIEEWDATKPMCTQDLLKKSFMEAFLLRHCTEGHLEVASTFSFFLLDWFSQWQSVQSPYWHRLYQGKRQGSFVGINTFMQVSWFYCATSFLGRSQALNPRSLRTPS